MNHIKTITLLLLMGLLLAPFPLFEQPQKKHVSRTPIKDWLPQRPAMPERVINDAVGEQRPDPAPIPAALGAIEEGAPPETTAPSAPTERTPAGAPAPAEDLQEGPEVESPHLKVADRLFEYGHYRRAHTYYKAALDMDGPRMPASQRKRLHHRMQDCLEGRASPQQTVDSS
ncbi:hypothetical protein ACFL2T_03960 [Elusimicrobiota bacterium]